jgi:hypothetical protein
MDEKIAWENVPAPSTGMIQSLMDPHLKSSSIH